MNNSANDDITESLKKTMLLLSDAFESKETEEANLLLGDLILELKKSSYHLENPENFNTIFMFKQKMLLKTIATNLHLSCDDNAKNEKANFVYTHYSFLSSHITRLVENKCDSSCSVDRSRFIIKQYLNWLITGELNEPDYEKEHYWIPKFGTLSDWFAFCDGLYLLYYGRPEAYLKSYQTLITADIRKYNHLLHRWFLKLKNEAPISIGTTWDENKKNPLENEYRQDENNYFVFKMKIPKHLANKFEPAEATDHLFGPYVNIPKCDVERIFYETEEVSI